MRFMTCCDALVRLGVGPRIPAVVGLTEECV